MKISIITVCFNAEATIANCIRSVEEQSHGNREHLILDGASTDDTLTVANSMAGERTRVVSEPDEGVYFALNKAIQMASGDVIGFLHADDVFYSRDVLASVSRALESSETEGCYSDLIYVKQGAPDEVVRYWKSEPFQPGTFKRGWMPAHPTFYARKEVYEKYGDFDTTMKIGADWDFLYRIFEEHRIKTTYVPETWVRMSLGGMSNRNWRNIAQNNFETWKFIRKRIGFGPSLLFPPLKWAHRFRQFRRRPE